MQTTQSESLVNATCAACGLLCDDIPVIGHAHAVTLTPATRCEKSIAFFTPLPSATSATINGKPVSLAQAVQHAATLLSASQQPLIAGLGTDLYGFRAAYQLAHTAKAGLAHMNASSTWRNIKVLQSTGWQTTTLTEVRNRADVIVCIGTDVVSHNPRFFERVVWPKEAMFVDNEAREVIYLGGEGLATQAGVSPTGKLPSVLPCQVTDLPEVTAALHALVLGKTLKATHIAGIALAELMQLAARLKQAKYAVLCWVAKDLDFPHAELTIQQITQTVTALNETTRAGALALGGSDGDTTVNYAHTWLSGLAIQQETLPAHDALVWVNSFSPNKALPVTSAPVIALGHPATQFAHQPEVFIPIATPGLDCAGSLFRVDSSVVLPLKPHYQSNYPTLAHVLAQIEGLLA